MDIINISYFITAIQSQKKNSNRNNDFGREKAKICYFGLNLNHSLHENRNNRSDVDEPYK
jgi:hypothetical protein